MMLNMPILGVVCEPKPSRAKKFEYFANDNVKAAGSSKCL